MNPIELLFRLEYKLSQDVLLPPSSWPVLRSKKVIEKLIADCPLDLVLKNKRQAKHYADVFAAFDPTKPLTSLTDLAKTNKYRVCYARDMFSLLYPHRIAAFTKLHDGIWRKRIENNERWQADLENAEFAAMYGHVFDKFAEMGNASELVEKADFPWDHLKLEPV